ncbi:MAG: isoprenylcysteine carboxylmethyltransferase family protein [Hyphomicrobiaceae bacterium]|nr:isoprenylcysteine carboxylmethyltransferase family protein [Hyphomicrobiaceae bacterium]
MTWLEHKIPPPVVAAVTGAAMWLVAGVTPAASFDPTLRIVAAGALIAVGLALMVAAVAAFNRAQTTINPVEIARASSLVTGGVFKLTRNPMYLGVALVLLAWAVYLAAPAALIGPIAFATFITRFQIVPEERVLADKFGDAFKRYTDQTRRWL